MKRSMNERWDFLERIVENIDEPVVVEIGHRLNTVHTLMGVMQSEETVIRDHYLLGSAQIRTRTASSVFPGSADAGNRTQRENRKNSGEARQGHHA